jgi:hypothetical protein
MNFDTDYISKNYNLHTNHPIQASAQEYLSYNKYVSIHSEDRDIIKYPNASVFEIEMPEDINKVVSVRLADWSFPANYNTFADEFGNLTMTFKITNPYNPSQYDVSDHLLEGIYECLFLTQTNVYTIIIETGFYTPQQMVTELTNKFNEAVTIHIKEYFTNQIKFQELLDSLNYNRFVIVYNEVKQNIWFGNTSDGFTITTSIDYALLKNTTVIQCKFNRTGQTLPDYSNGGLPGHLGLTIVDTPAVSIAGYSPRFYYGDVNYGDDGFWLVPPSFTGSQVYYIDSPNKVNLMGPAYLYMEIDGLNNINETSPFNDNAFTRQTNETNGRVNTAFAKIPIPTTPLSQYFDKNEYPFKYFSPPAERIRRLSIRIRYHNNRTVDFSTFPFSFLLEFNTLQPQILRKGKIVSSTGNLVIPQTVNYTN